MPPLLVAALTPEAAWVIGGTAVAEIVFATPGLSEFVLRAVTNRDFVVLQTYVAVIASWLLAVRGLGRLTSSALSSRATLGMSLHPSRFRALTCNPT